MDISASALMLETVWLKQNTIEDAESAFQQLSLEDEGPSRTSHEVSHMSFSLKI